jgi:adenosylmethionine-8-amino-7-oxononanoate aminotransferase
MLEHRDALTPAEVVAADQGHVVHGFAPLELRAVPGPIFREGRGIHLIDVHGQDWVDACAGQANVTLGYSREELAEVAARALKELSFATTFYQGRGHVPGARLAKKLVEITPAGIDQFFYTVGGSDAVETAIKFARWVNAVNGRPEKYHIIGRVRSYHGVSYGALSLTGDPEMWNNVGPRLAGFSHIEQPTSDSVGAAQALEDEILRLGAERVAAFMAEPISTPNGIRVPPADYWPQIREICDRHELLLITDEILTGFGRTGRMFAGEHWQVEPDLMTMSKGITAGYFPLAVVGLTSELLDRMSTAGTMFNHGFTASGHPAGCAVALATIDIMEREDVLDRATHSGERLRAQLAALAERHAVLDRASVRGIGMMAAVDFDMDAVEPAFCRAVHEQFLRKRIFLRDYLNGQTIGFLPALTCSEDDINEIIGRTEDAIATVEASR